MSTIDWLVLVATLGFIVIYGIWKTTGSKNINEYLLADKSLKWYTICISIMATQASAITFLSTPGQAYEDGMGFIQVYFGLPIAMVIISITAVPLFSRLKVYTAYEYLESRFDLKTRSLTATLFLIQRGLSTGITIYAPSIILSAVLGWNLTWINIIIGILVLLYTVSGGTKAVSVTQQQQMAVMMGGMIVAGLVVIYQLPKDFTLFESIQIAGKMDKLNLVSFEFDPNSRYNFWSGIIGGLFLSLSYFGTDQSQVARYLSGETVTESRLGLLFNGLLKIPMQFIILSIGVLVFLFYQFQEPPVFFNQHILDKAKETTYKQKIADLEKTHQQIFIERKKEINHLVEGFRNEDQTVIDQSQEKLMALKMEAGVVKDKVKDIIKEAVPESTAKDTDYVFVSFIMKYMPPGLIGLLLAVILCATMSSTSGQLNALASATAVDIYKRSVYKNGSEHHYLSASRWFTVLWAVLVIAFALLTSFPENLIQFVNILGSLFYGTILGIFMTAFYVKFVKATAVFYAAIISEILIIGCYLFTDIAFLWYNVIGCIFVVVIAVILQLGLNTKTPQ